MIGQEAGFFCDIDLKSYFKFLNIVFYEILGNLVLQKQGNQYSGPAVPALNVRKWNVFKVNG